mgnify:CR=1 FL=1
MLVTIDKSAMTAEQREYSYRGDLTTLVTEVAKANPLLNFVCDAHCVTKEWNRNKPHPNGDMGCYENFIYRVKVFQDGEELGALLATTRYRRSIGSEDVYGVESFRIRKERGRDDTTFTKDLKVALRTAKKTLVARGDTELFTHIYNEVRSSLQHFANSTYNGIRYSIDISSEATAYAEAAYQAYKEGKTTVELPVKLKSVSNYEDYLKRCEEHEVASTLNNNMQKGIGYPVKVLEDGKVICLDLDKGKAIKYNSFDDVPTEISSKLAMFKVLGEHEPYAHLGVKFQGGFFFIVK